MTVTIYISHKNFQKLRNEELSTVNFSYEKTASNFVQLQVPIISISINEQDMEVATFSL